MYSNRGMIDCQPEERDGRSVCRFCGDEVPAHVHRNCRAAMLRSTVKERMARTAKLARTRPERDAAIREANRERRQIVDEATRRLGLIEKTKHYAAALWRWGKAGFPVRSDEEIAALVAICQGCQFQREETCTICGCCVSQAMPAIKSKVKMSSEVCPKGRWPT
jgi:hypothetical protein